MAFHSERHIRVFLVEGQTALRQALESVITTTPGLRCIGSASTVETALRDGTRLHPDVAVVDLCLSGISALDCLHSLHRNVRGVKSVALSHFNRPGQLFDTLAVGASACLLKPIHPAQLIEAIEIVHQGGSLASPTLTRQIFDRFRKASDAAVGLGALSGREREILHLAKHGLSNDLIASQLRIEYNTVRTHLRNIYHKLAVTSRGEAVAKLYQL